MKKNSKSTKAVQPAAPTWEEIKAKHKADSEALEAQITWVKVIEVDRQKSGVGYIGDKLVIAELCRDSVSSVKECSLRESADYMRKMLSAEIMTLCDSQTSDEGQDRWLGEVALEA